MINIDCVGVKNKKNCVMSNVSSLQLQDYANKAAVKLELELGEESMPSGAAGDFIPFYTNGFGSDLFLSFAFNLTGCVLPQRSYFSSSKELTATISFSSCKLLTFGDILSSIIFIPAGSIHGPRDNVKKLDPVKLNEQYLIIDEMIRLIEENKE
jgi:hypothetical protein